LIGTTGFTLLAPLAGVVVTTAGRAAALELVGLSPLELDAAGCSGWALLDLFAEHAPSTNAAEIAATAPTIAPRRRLLTKICPPQYPPQRRRPSNYSHLISHRFSDAERAYRSNERTLHTIVAYFSALLRQAEVTK